MKRLVLLMGVLAAMFADAEIQVKDGDKVVFLGDSITWGGTQGPGYCRLVVEALAANGITVKPVFKGIIGDTAPGMLRRFKKDVLDEKPQWLTISCGVNDCGTGGVGHERTARFDDSVTNMITQAAAAGIRTVLFAPTPVGEVPDSPLNAKMADYADWMKRTADAYGLGFGDMFSSAQAVTRARLKALPPDCAQRMFLSYDTIHRSGVGYVVMGLAALDGFGFSPEEKEKAVKRWREKKIVGEKMLKLAQGDFSEYSFVLPVAEREAKGAVEILSVMPRVTEAGYEATFRIWSNRPRRGYAALRPVNAFGCGSFLSKNVQLEAGTNTVTFAVKVPKEKLTPKAYSLNAELHLKEGNNWCHHVFFPPFFFPAGD